MADVVRTATSIWIGNLKSGMGKTSTDSGVLKDAQITYPSRFETGAGTNPEELIASAHASCFSMALAHGLSQEGHPPEEIKTKATLTLSSQEQGFKITAIHLETEGRVPGIDDVIFQQSAQVAKETCPVSLLLKSGLNKLTLSASLAQAKDI